MDHQDWNTVTFQTPKKLPVSSGKGNMSSNKEYSLVNKDLPLQLQQARQAKNLTQKQLATRCNIDVHDIAAWEKGNRLPTNDIIAKLSKELSIRLPRNSKIHLE